MTIYASILRTGGLTRAAATAAAVNGTRVLA